MPTRHAVTANGPRCTIRTVPQSEHRNLNSVKNERHLSLAVPRCFPMTSPTGKPWSAMTVIRMGESAAGL